MSDNMNKTLNFSGIQVPTVNILFNVNSKIMKPSEIDIDKVVISDMVEYTINKNKNGTIKFKRIFVGYKVSDKNITSLCIQAPKQDSYGIQKYNENAKWKVCFIRDETNMKQEAFINCLEKIDKRVCELAKNYKHPMIAHIFANSPIKDGKIPTFCQQKTKVAEGEPIQRIITTAFYNKHRIQVDPKIYDGKKLSMVAAITFRDVYLSSNALPEKSLEIRQAVITGAHDAPKQELMIEVDDADFSDDEDDDFNSPPSAFADLE